MQGGTGHKGTGQIGFLFEEIVGTTLKKLAEPMKQLGWKFALLTEQEIRDRFEHQIAAVIDAGACRMQATTVVDLTPMGTGGDPQLIRHGAGDITLLGL